MSAHGLVESIETLGSWNLVGLFLHSGDSLVPYSVKVFDSNAWDPMEKCVKLRHFSSRAIGRSRNPQDTRESSSVRLESSSVRLESSSVCPE